MATLVILAAGIGSRYQEQNAVPKDWNQPLNREKPWGTGHALLSVETLIDTPFGVINADDFYISFGIRVRIKRLSFSFRTRLIILFKRGRCGLRS